MNFMASYIPSNMPLNTPNTIQTPSSLVDSLSVSYAMLLISNGFKSCLSFPSWLSMKLVILGLMLHIFGSILNTYGSYLNSIHHSYFYIHQFSPLAQHFSIIALYPYGDTKPLVFVVPYDNISDISESFNPH